MAAEQDQKPSAPRQVTTMRLRQETLDALGKEATKRGISRNLLSEQVLIAFLKKNGHRIKMEPKI